MTSLSFQKRVNPSRFEKLIAGLDWRLYTEDTWIATVFVLNSIEPPTDPYGSVFYCLNFLLCHIDETPFLS